MYSPLPVAARRRDLLDLLTEDLAATLLALRELLPEYGDKHSQVLAIQARLKETNKQRMFNTISPEDYQRRVDTVRAACFELIKGLEEVDFEAPVSTKATAGKQGSVLYRVPHKMPIQKPSICLVRVAIDADALLEDIVIDDDIRLRERVQVSDMMRADLLDPENDVFSIRTLSAEEQLVREEGYTQWLFSVTPRIAGEHQLLIKVSMLEYNPQLGKYIPREVSILETVTIVTESAGLVIGEEEVPIKSTGERFALAGSTATWMGREETVPSSRTGSGMGRRAVTFFLVFLILGGSLFALVPSDTRDWLLTRYLENTPEAYTAYSKEHPKSKYRDDAFYLKALLTDLPIDYFTYLDSVGTMGKYQERVQQHLQVLESRHFDVLFRLPDTVKVRQFLWDFPLSERLPAVKQIVDNHTDLTTALPLIEAAYVRAAQTDPQPKRITAYLRDFPHSEHLNEVAAAAASRPEVLRAIQPDLERAMVQKIEQATRPAEAGAALLGLEIAGSPAGMDKAEKAVAQKPLVFQMEVQPQLRQVKELVKVKAGDRLPVAEEEKGKVNEEVEKVRPQILQRRIKEKKDDTDRSRLQKEAVKVPEPVHQQQEVEVKRDADGDGTPDQSDGCPNDKYKIRPGKCGCGMADVDGDGDKIPDCQDNCPNEIGDADHQGCPPPKPFSNDQPTPTDKSVIFQSMINNMVFVQRGSFTMGSPAGEENRLPDECEHTVTVDSFYLSKYEVTQQQWEAVMGSNPSDHKDCPQCPVVYVSWNMVQDFLKKLNAATGKKYRLPTEAEWEYAAKGGPRSMHYPYAGSRSLNNVGWYSENSGRAPHPVGNKIPNELGLYDMSGNVWEWCQDKYSAYPGCETIMSEGIGRVCRGGGYGNGSRICRSTGRDAGEPSYLGWNLGFRLACGALR